MQLKYWWMNVCACGRTQKCTYTSISTGQWNLQATGSTITRPLTLLNMSGSERLSVTDGPELVAGEVKLSIFKISSFPVGTSAVGILIQCVSHSRPLLRRNTMIDVLLLFINSINWKNYVCRSCRNANMSKGMREEDSSWHKPSSYSTNQIISLNTN